MGLISFMKGALRRMLKFDTIERAEQVSTPLSSQMTSALRTWSAMYTNQAHWLKPGKVKSLNLPAFVSGELARQIVLEMKVTITGKDGSGNTTDANGKQIKNERSEFLAAEFEKLLVSLRQKLEQGLAAGGMIIKPYVADDHLYFDTSLDWDIYPLAFDSGGDLRDVIIPDFYSDGKYQYTRLERHTAQDDGVLISNTCYKSSDTLSLGKEVPLTEVEQWADLEQSTFMPATGGQLFGWFKVAAANSVDLHCPMGSSCFAKAADVIKEADLQYSRLLWEFEGSELAIDVDPTALRPKKAGKGYEMPHLNDRLFRAVDIERDGNEFYSVFSPSIREASLLNGLNALLQKVEDLCGLSRGSLSDADNQAKTATELIIQKQRSYATVADNQRALERCLRDVIRAMADYADLYDLAPAGEYDVSFDWDDSIIVDTEKRMTQMLTLMNSGIISKTEMRKWYFGETEAQAQAAIEAVENEKDADDAFPLRGS